MISWRPASRRRCAPDVPPRSRVVDLELDHVGDRSAMQQLRSDVSAGVRGVSICSAEFIAAYSARLRRSFPRLDGLCLLAPISAAEFSPRK